ncbi:hypothetical protein N7492_005450 [Penicillium capsulatum]|uniref:Uncharacterized protein n=1 Tax=Penicillium capsulatum TaxID=69766 RepID=A0A9W9LR56_9EURO|nr:hypothetical protein N7492_005450 [Penicillium capsulatum]KAJ6135449.1 hypothetical protein N7512_000609 [Penicillium capsulatum]
MDDKDQEALDDILQAYGFDDEGNLLEPRIVTPPIKYSHYIDDAQPLPDNQNLAGDDKALSSSVDIEPSRRTPSQRSTLPDSLDPSVKSQLVEDKKSATDTSGTQLDDSAVSESSQLLLPLEPPGHDLDRPQPADLDLSEESDDEVTTQLSCRLGKIQFTQDGQLRYFGSTSNLHLLDVLVSVTLPAPKIAQKETQEILDNARLNADIDEAFEKHLIELYFTWQDPSLHLVDYDQFWRSRAQHNYDGLVSPYYSRSLADAM